MSCCCREGWVNLGCKDHGIHAIHRPEPEKVRTVGQSARKPDLAELDRMIRLPGDKHMFAGFRGSTKRRKA